MGDTGIYKEYLAGLLAGVATVITGHPFDTVKVKLQKHNAEAHAIKYRNGLHCTTRILKTEGVKGLYRGATSSFIGMAFESSLLFGIYSQTKQSLQVAGIFRGGFTTLLRESFGNAVFFSVYEYVRYYMHLQLKASFSVHNNFIDMELEFPGLLFCPWMWRKLLSRLLQIKAPPEIHFEYLTRSGSHNSASISANAAAIVTWELATKMLGIRHD
ncbi:hypothetical protein GH714_016521 [Hevea brasiliensis]|uniref:Uncharacterized protein n=1 Tax=Hevea brasiliensis TaxID=3981 RepID=A0A6A6LS26_HEVBR|nr:hypothetical protein GH714_016521 [Hevea brasiliensis]